MAAIAADVVGYWRHAGAAKWFKKSAAFDDALRLRFEPVHHTAARGEYSGWSATPEGALALALLLDQIPRNIYRNSAHAFATDPLARAVCDKALDRALERDIEPALRVFLYMPFMHSENIADQDRSVILFEKHDVETGDVDSLKYAVMHREIIQKFGRFPHRNAAFGRTPTPEEQVFLAEGGFGG